MRDRTVRGSMGFWGAGIAGFAALVGASGSPAGAQSRAPGLGPAGELTALAFEEAGPAVLRGADARRQLVVTGTFSSGQQHDLTRDVAWSTAPAGIATVDETGFVVPVGDGEVTITAKAKTGRTATMVLRTAQVAEPLPIHFVNQVVPIFTRLGCNTGGCHGKSGGQNGFKLSLLGFYPEEDYEFLVKETRGRRLFPSSPEFSLLLLKPTNLLAHGGGRRLEMDSYEGRILRRWVEQGLPYGAADDPVVAKVEVLPRTRTMNRGKDQQLRAVATYTDGSTQDVTRMASFESNDFEMAEVTSTGLVKTLDLPGDAAVMVRFQGQVDVFRASIPLGLPVQTPAPRNLVDEHVFAKLKSLGIPPSVPCDDATFLRRVSVDLTGRLPTAEEARAFAESRAPDKRDQAIDRLLESPGYGDFFANKWNSVLRNRTNFAFHAWIRRALQQNMRYDDFARNVLAATGEPNLHPPASWFVEVNQPLEQAEDAAQLFLGMRIQCARCHHHPFERWSQNDYYGFVAFFSQVGRKPGRNIVSGNAVQTTRVVHRVGKAKALNPRTEKDVFPTGLGGAALDIPEYEDPRPRLVDWMTDAQNPFFARALVNRYWKHFFARGIVEPEDDMRVTNPPVNPALLDALARHFVANGYDLKDLVRTLCRSQAYQLSSEPNGFNVDDRQNFSSYYPRRLNAEVLYDALNQVTGSTTAFQNLPAGTRAVQLPDNQVGNYFLQVFGKPASASACEWERSSDANLAQSLHLLNSAEVQGKVASGTGTAAALAKEDGRTRREKVDGLYLTVYGRLPKDHERALIDAHLDKATAAKQGWEDVLWALLNTKEFLFNH